MRKIAITLLLAIGIITTNSCNKLDEFTKFNLNYDATVVLPANSVINLPISLFTPDITTNYEDQFSSNDTRKDLVQEITIDGISIVVQKPQGQTLDFLKSIEVYISADGLDEIQVASKYDIPDGLTTLQLDYVSDNLKDYITKESIKLRVKTIMDKTLNQDTELKVNTRFKVNAKILGV
jgi:hypothetical protein